MHFPTFPPFGSARLSINPESWSRQAISHQLWKELSLPSFPFFNALCLLYPSCPLSFWMGVTGLISHTPPLSSRRCLSLSPPLAALITSRADSTGFFWGTQHQVFPLLLAQCPQGQTPLRLGPFQLWQKDHVMKGAWFSFNRVLCPAFKWQMNKHKMREALRVGERRGRTWIHRRWGQMYWSVKKNGVCSFSSPRYPRSS